MAPGAERCKAPEKPKPVPRPPLQTSPVRRPRARIPEPDAEPTPGDSDRSHPEDPTAPSAPAVQDDQPRGFGVVGGSGLLDTEAVSICMPVPFGEEAGGAGRPLEAAPRRAHENGIGRSVADAGTNSGSSAFGYHSSEPAALRPDIATGRPGPLDQEVLLGSGELQVAANQERFVAAARAGEVGDLQQLFSRSGVRVDGSVSEGQACNAHMFLSFGHALHRTFRRPDGVGGSSFPWPRRCRARSTGSDARSDNACKRLCKRKLALQWHCTDKHNIKEAFSIWAGF